MPLSDYTGKTDATFVEVNGVRLTLKEFDMRTRALWLDIAKEYNLPELQSHIQSEVLPKMSSIGHDIQNDPRIQSVQKRLEKLQERHDSLLDTYGTDEEPEDIDEQLEKIIQRMEGLSEEQKEITARVRDEVVEQTKKAEREITELVEVQDKARIDFVWRLATAVGKTDTDFEEFYQSCDSGDYEAADRFLTEGNAPWASLYTGRMQERPKRQKN